MSGHIVYEPARSGNGHDCEPPAFMLYHVSTIWRCDCGAYWERVLDQQTPPWVRISSRRAKRRVKERGGSWRTEA